MTPSGLRGADVSIHGSLIVSVAAYDAAETVGVVLDAGDRLVFPGLVALRRSPPGLVAPAVSRQLTRASALRGLTLLVAPADASGSGLGSTGDLVAASDLVAGNAWVDRGFLAELPAGGVAALDRLVEAGALGFIASPQLAAEIPSDEIRRSARVLGQVDRPLLVPCPRPEELPTWIDLSRRSDCSIHLLGFTHVESLGIIGRARSSGTKITLDAGADDLLDPSSTIRDALWDGLRSALIDFIGPSTSRTALAPDFSALWAEGVARGIDPVELARWLAGGAAALAGFSGRKGLIAPGHDADLLLFDPDARSKASRSPTDPTGRVVGTVLRGRMLDRSGRVDEPPPGVVATVIGQTEPFDQGVTALNGLPQAEAIEFFRCCCRSTRWACRMEALRPFESIANLAETADRVWRGMDRADRLEAYAAHARWQDPSAPEEIRRAIAEGIEAYERKFGHAYLADPDTPGTDALLDQIWRRLSHHPDVEAKIVADIEARHLRRRLRQLLG